MFQKLLTVLKTTVGCFKNFYKKTTKFLCRIYEKVMFNQVNDNFENFCLFYSKQFGFRNKHSTIDTLVVRISGVVEKKCYKTFFDIREAFDTPNHQLLLSELGVQGVKGTCFD